MCLSISTFIIFIVAAYRRFLSFLQLRSGVLIFETITFPPRYASLLRIYFNLRALNIERV